jgi:hypothetical protein
MELLAEYDTEVLPQDQTAEAFTTLSRAKADLAAAFKSFGDQTGEIESNEKRLSDSKKEKADLLGAEMDEQEQVGKLGKIAALQWLLESKIEQGRNRLESAEPELRQAVEGAYKSFSRALSALVDARRAGYIARLKEMVAPEQWPWAETHALSFIRQTPDLLSLDMLGDQAARMLQARDARKAAENLLMDISKLEGFSR